MLVTGSGHRRKGFFARNAYECGQMLTPVTGEKFRKTEGLDLRIAISRLMDNTQSVDVDDDRGQAQSTFGMAEKIDQGFCKVLWHQGFEVFPQLPVEFGDMAMQGAVVGFFTLAPSQLLMLGSGIGLQAVAFQTQLRHMGVESGKQAFQRLGSQSCPGATGVTAWFDQRLIGKIENFLCHIVVNDVALLRHAELAFLLPAGSKQGVEFIAGPALRTFQKIPHGLAAPEHGINVVGGGKQGVHQRIASEGLAVDIDRAGQRCDQAFAITQRMADSVHQMVGKAGSGPNNRVDHGDDALGGCTHLGVRWRCGLQQISQDG